MQPIVFARTFSSNFPEPEARDRVVAVLESDPHVRPTDHRDIFSSGSRLWFRIWGLWGPNARRRLPALWTITTTDKSEVTLELRSDEGPYLVRLPIVEIAYQRACDHVAVRIETALRA